MKKINKIKYLTLAMGLLIASNAKATLPELCALAANNDTSGLEAALNQGADPNTICDFSDTDRHQETLFAYTIRFPVITSLLISRGVSPSAVSVIRGSWGRRTTFSNFDKACANSIEATKAFLDNGVNPETVDASLNTNDKPLHWALFRSQIKDKNLRLQISDLLIAHGASPYGSQSNKTSQLSFLIMEKEISDTAVLERIKNWNFQGDLNSVQDYLEMAISANRGVSILKELKAKGGNLLATFFPNRPQSAISLYSFYLEAWGTSEPEALSMVNWLLHEGVSVHGNNDNALNNSIFLHFNSLTDVLLAAGIDVNNSQALYFVASLWTANPEYQINVASKLLNYGADINLGGPLASAVYGKNMKFVKFLIKKGADINFPTADGLTPLCAASWNHDKKMINFLKSRGAVSTKCWF